MQMYRFTWLVVLLTCASLPGVALPQETKVPKLVLSQEAWNFGEVWHPDSPTMTLIVRNEGNAELVLTNVTSTCGCTVVQPARDRIPAGENTEVTVRYNSEGKQDHVDSKVIIESNDPVRPKVEMRIDGVVRRAVKRTPLGGLTIRSLDPSAGQTGSIRLENQMSEPMKLKLISTNLPDLDVSVEETTPGLVYIVTAKTKHELPPGSLRRGRLIFSTGLSKESQLSIGARVEIMSRVQVMPPIIYLDPKTATTASERAVSLQYYGTGPFNVTGATANHPDIKVTVRAPEPPIGGLEKLTPKLTCVVRTQVKLPPASALPPEGAVITYTTDDKDFPKFEVLVTSDPREWDLKLRGPPESPQQPVP